MSKTEPSARIGQLLETKAITRAELDAAVEAFLTNPQVGPFEVSAGYTVDLTAAVKADRHASATFKEPTAKIGSRRAAVRSALLLAKPM